MADLNYGEWTVDAVARDRAQASDKTEILKLREGRNILRFLPPPKGAGSPFVVVWQHYVEGLDGNRLIFPCPLKNHKQFCPVCEKANDLSRTGNPVDREQAYQLWPKMRVFAEVVDMDNSHAGPQVFAFGKLIYEQLVKIRTDSRLGGNFTDPEDGFDIIIDRSGSGKFDTRYTVNSDKLNASALEDFTWLDYRNDLARFKTAAPNHVVENAAKAVGAVLGPVIDALPAPKGRTIADDVADMV